MISHREKKSQYKKYIHELNQGDLQFPMKIKDIPTFEQMNDLNIKVFELSSNDKAISPEYTNKNFYEKQVDVIHSENHFYFSTDWHNFFRYIENYKHLCRRCLNTYGCQKKPTEHMLIRFEKKVCNKS